MHPLFSCVGLSCRLVCVWVLCVFGWCRNLYVSCRILLGHSLRILGRRLFFFVSRSCFICVFSMCSKNVKFDNDMHVYGRSQWPRFLRRRSAAARLLRSWVRIPPEGWMFVCCECCVLSGRGLCDELITRPEESYRLWCVVVV